MPSAMHRVFFALLPGAGPRQAIERAAAELKAANVVRGRFTAPEKYHLTVHFLGEHREPTPLIARAGAAAARVRHAAFDYVLDRVTTFRGRYQVPCILRCARDSEPVLASLHDALGAELERERIARDHERRFQPHLTIAYGDRMLHDPVAFEPIVLHATQFVLVDSHVGSGRHEVVGTWPLHVASPAAAVHD